MRASLDALGYAPIFEKCFMAIACVGSNVFKNTPPELNGYSCGQRPARVQTITAPHSVPGPVKPTGMLAGES